MNNFHANYVKILDILQQVEKKKSFLHQIRQPKLSDIELIAITVEYMSIDSEYQLFRVLPVELSMLIERSVYNRRKLRLLFHREQIRKQLAAKISFSDYYIADSMPLEVCKLSRSVVRFVKKILKHRPTKVIVPLKSFITMVINYMLFAILMVYFLILI